MTTVVETHLNMNKNQIQNAVVHNLSQAPTNPKAGQKYFNTVDKKEYLFNGTAWVTLPDVSEFITADSIETLTNKKINADNNTISNLEVDNFKSGIVVTSIAATGSDTTIPTEKAVRTAINTALQGGLLYKGTWEATSQTGFSSITLPVKKGDMFLVTGTATTISNITYTAGDYIVINTDTASSETLTQARVDKIDNTESTDIVKLADTQTLTNKTINASNNTLSNLTTSMFKSGEIITSITSGSTKIPTSGAVYTSISSKAALASPTFTGTPKAPTAAVGTNTTQIATTAFVQSAITNATESLGSVNKVSVVNPALTVTDGMATWTISHTLKTQEVLVALYTVASNEKVIADIATASTSTVVVRFNADADIASNTYKAIIIG